MPRCLARERECRATRSLLQILRMEKMKQQKTISTGFADSRPEDSSRKLVFEDRVPSSQLKQTEVPTRVKRKLFPSVQQLSVLCPIMPSPTSTSTSESSETSYEDNNAPTFETGVYNHLKCELHFLKLTRIQTDIDR